MLFSISFYKFTTQCTAVDLSTHAATKMMTRSKTREAAENHSPNIEVSKKMMEKHASIESVMTLEEFNSRNSSYNEHNCSLDDNFNTSFTSSTTDSVITEDFQDAESTLQASDNIQYGANSAMSGSDGTLVPSSVTGLTIEAAETTAGDQHAPTTEAMDGTIQVMTAAMETT